MPAIVDNVIFDTIAREWRCKWSEEAEKASLSACSALLNDTLDKIKAVDGCKGVQRMVCGGCFDFKVIISMAADKFDKLEASGLEGPFLDDLKAIEGVSAVEAQSMTIASM